MTIYLKDVIGNLPDNDLLYFKLLEGLINSHDNFCECEIRKSSDCYYFRLVLTLPEVMHNLIESINDLHNTLSLKVDYSKSMKKNSSISWKLYI